MALNFPDSPSNGDYYNGFVYDSTSDTWRVRGSVENPAGISGTTGSPTETTDGSATIYTFTGDGSITVGVAGVIHIFGIGGGGGSKGYGRPSGGGAGVVFEKSDYYVTAGTYTITVGAGGTGSGNAAGHAGFGNDTTFGDDIVCHRGGAGFSIAQVNWQNRGYYIHSPGGNYISSTNGVGGCFGAGAGNVTNSTLGYSSDISGSTVVYGTGGDDNDQVAGPANSGDGAGGVNGVNGVAGGSGVFIVRVG